MSSFSSFSSLPLNQSIADVLERRSFHQMTPVQQETLPHSLDGRDVLAKARTGSGKTLAFLLPVFNKLELNQYSPQAIILCPTRELAEQVAQEARVVGQVMGNVKVLAVYGGVPIRHHIQSLEHGAHIIVGTPGRVKDLLARQQLDFSQITFRVLDEVDRMLDLGFHDDVAEIFSAITTPVQTLMFSATLPAAVETLASRFLRQPLKCEISAPELAQPQISEVAYHVGTLSKLQALKALLTTCQPTSAIIFCNRRIHVAEVVDELSNAGFSVQGLDGGMEQAKRNEVIIRFSAKALQILVATDVAARGLDIEQVDHVFNYSVSEEVESHIHRIGRTARGDAEGTAITLYDDNELAHLNKIEAFREKQFVKKSAQSLTFQPKNVSQPAYTCLVLSAGKKSKIRPGDIVGALTNDAAIQADDIGNIKVVSNASYVAVKTRSAKRAMAHFREGKIKGKKVRCKKLT
ncbi:ATP-dependent RNA helicase DbpA [Alteromonas ponticola]|uniref:ATP-dependent RNA helicase DbpA n=1 Tax=Alteromonas aquimaris TaxID=2998417 RepID=A0ABT3P8W1_9ALTE|nr:ATP-dependent RNA helicase DbpA [Alteromonas aquimaris]MCW8109207.1 ATP-dependent RNA helicase DbpA [Alteromonas aquimaris]